MSANYLHGVETVRVERGSRPVKTVKSAVIAIIGTALSGPVNRLTLCLNEKDDAQFGDAASGFTLASSLSALRGFGAGAVLVVNVFDAARHKTSVTDKVVTFTATTLTMPLGAENVRNVVVKNSPAGTTTYVAGTDYTVDAKAGTITRLAAGAITATGAVKVSYDYSDVAQVSAGDIIGATDFAGNRSGLQGVLDAYNLWGFDAKILISPVYGSLKSVSSQLEVMAEKLGAVAYVDLPVGATPSQAVSSRGPSGLFDFNTASDRLRVCYPMVQRYDEVTNSQQLFPLSVYAAGLRAKVDLDKGFWWSSSNQELLGITGMERPLTARIDDAGSEVNMLNEVGITTIFNSFGTGLRLWGNRNTAFPTVTHMRNFENVRRTQDMIDESLRFFSLQYMDMPISQALIDDLTESVNAYGRKLQGDGAVLGFKCWYDPDRNTKEELSAGHLLLSYKFTPPPPMERLTFESEITSDYLVNLKGAA